MLTGILIIIGGGLLGGAFYILGGRDALRAKKRDDIKRMYDDENNRVN